MAARITHVPRLGWVIGPALALLASAVWTPPVAAVPTLNSADRCELPMRDAGEVDEVDGSLAVFIDATVSWTGQTDVNALVADLVDTVTTDRAVRLSMFRFGGTDAEVVALPCFRPGAPFVPNGRNSYERSANRAKLLHAVRNAVVNVPTTFSSSDPLTALRAGVQLVDRSESVAMVVVVTDGVVTTGCAELPAETEVSDAGLIEQLVEGCSRRGLLPPADGIEVMLGGIGRAAGVSDHADAVTFLLAYNTALCEATGATCSVGTRLPTPTVGDDDGGQN